MRQLVPPKLDALKEPELRYMIKSLFDVVGQHGAILSNAVELGQQPAANPTPVVVIGGNPATPGLPSPTLGTLLRGTAGGQWENLALGASGTVLTSSSGNANWATTSALGLATLSGNNTWTGTQDFQGTTAVYDNLFTIWEPGGSAKRAQFDVSSIWPATLRTFVLPDANTTLAGLGVAQTFTKAQTIDPDSDVVALKITPDAAHTTSNVFEIYDPGGANLMASVDAGGESTYAALKISNGPIDGVNPVANLDVASLSSDQTYTFPATGGTFILTTGNQTLGGTKTLSDVGVASVLKANTSSSGVSFTDFMTSGKKLRFVLSGASANDHYISLSTTAQRNWTLPDKSGTLPVPSNTPGAYYVLSVGASGQELWQALDNNHLSNRTRKVWYSMGEFYGTSLGTNGLDTTVGASTSTLGSYHQITAGGSSPVTGYIHVPYDAVTGTGTFKLYMATSSTNVNTVTIACSIHVIGASTAINATATSTANTNCSPTGTAHQNVITQLGNSITISAGDVLRITLDRGTDTNPDVAELLGVMLEYTADM